GGGRRIAGAEIAVAVAGGSAVAAVLVVVAVRAQQLPVAAVRRIVVVIVVAVVHGQLAQVGPAELPTAAAANPGKKPERLLAVALFALQALGLGGGDDAVQSCLVRSPRCACHACLVASAIKSP